MKTSNGKAREKNQTEKKKRGAGGPSLLSPLKTASKQTLLELKGPGPELTIGKEFMPRPGRSIKEADKKFLCAMCAKNFATYDDLKGHIQKVHQNLKTKDPLKIGKPSPGREENKSRINMTNGDGHKIEREDFLSCTQKNDTKLDRGVHRTHLNDPTRSFNQIAAEVKSAECLGFVLKRLRLAQYSETLFAKGFTTVESLRNLPKESLKEHLDSIKMKPGHQLKIHRLCA
eukprot:CAMPEP_0114496300 /NCGR_PEP_ID=MMETSP0109-20121206/5696_1 /TAXON_ID=29199 /ORGANISM="Chlorarachnion reptans, Strain CCCM449" /LENGTH=229 /DNA_ID=CAMNT_0001673563 /DNA_START=97 /DNA_END=783 /DNA_ORIENTATION=+